MLNEHIGVLGAGHMGHALSYGLLKNGSAMVNNMSIADPRSGNIKELEVEFGGNFHRSNTDLATLSDIIIIAVRPETVRQVATEIKANLKPNVLILSASACVTHDLLTKYFEKPLRIARIMPNIGVTYGHGVIGYVGNQTITEEDKRLIEQLLSPLGMVFECKNEESLDKLTVVTGCSPGYFAYFMENMEKIAHLYGFDENEAKTMVQTTVEGTVKHVQSTYIPPAQLVHNVATRGGITEEILHNFDQNNFFDILKKSIEIGYHRVQNTQAQLRKEVGI